MKQIISIILAISISLVLTIPIYATDHKSISSEKETIQSRYAYTTTVSSSLTISSGVASCKSTAVGNSNVIKIKATQCLEKKNGNNWSSVSGGIWTDSSDGNFFTTTNTKSALPSGTYRVRTIFIVYTQSDYEQVEKISTEKTI